MQRRMTVAVLLLAGCEEQSVEPGLRIKDTSGAEFLWVCDEGEHCAVHRIAGVSPPPPPCADDQEPRYTVLGRNRFFVITGGCFEDVLIWFGLDRIVVCEEDDDCPQLAEYDHHYECRAGLCQDRDTETFPPDAVTFINMYELCFGDLPRYEDGPFPPWSEYPADTIDAIGQACSGALEPCEGELPAGCIDPR